VEDLWRMLEFNEIAKRKCNKLDSGVKGMPMPLTHAQNGGKGQTTAAARIPPKHTHTPTTSALGENTYD